MNLMNDSQQKRSFDFTSSKRPQAPDSATKHYGLDDDTHSDHL